MCDAYRHAGSGKAHPRATVSAQIPAGIPRLSYEESVQHRYQAIPAIHPAARTSRKAGVSCIRWNPRTIREPTRRRGYLVHHHQGVPIRNSFRAPGTGPTMEGAVQTIHPMGHAARHQARRRVPSQTQDGHHFTQATEVRTGLARIA